MKKLIIFSLLFIFSFVVHATSIVNPKNPSGDQIMMPLGDGTFMISINDYTTLSPKKYQEITGQKLTVKEKIKLKLTQSMLKKAVKRKDLSKKGLFDSWSWHWGGFALGFFLSILGVIIALFINDDYKTDRFRTALFTAGLVITILAAVAAAFAAP